MITVIVACADAGAIGRDGTMPWHLPADLALFQRETTGGAVIMGRRTWHSFPVRPLKNRLNIVVSRGAVDAPVVCPSVEAALAAARAEGHTRIYAIGGANIYAALLPLAHRLMITRIALSVPDADTFFPPFDPADWRLIDERLVGQGAPAAVLHEYVRRS